MSITQWLGRVAAGVTLGAALAGCAPRPRVGPPSAEPGDLSPGDPLPAP